MTPPRRSLRTTLLVLGAAVLIAASVWVGVAFPTWVLSTAYLALAALLALLDALWRARQRRAALRVARFEGLSLAVLGRHLAVLIGALPGWRARASSNRPGVSPTVTAEGTGGRVVLFVLDSAGEEDLPWLVELQGQLGVVVVQVVTAQESGAGRLEEGRVWRWSDHELRALQTDVRERGRRPPEPLAD